MQQNQSSVAPSPQTPNQAIRNNTLRRCAATAYFLSVAPSPQASNQAAKTVLRRPNWRVPAFIAVLVLTFGMALLGSKQVALAGESNHTGLVESMPSNGLQGNWIVGGVRFVTNGSTEFRQEKGALAVGVCAEVEYVGSAQPYTATKIASKSSDDCNGSGTVTPSVTPDSTPSPGSE